MINGDSRIDDEITRLASGFTEENVCIGYFDLTNDRIRIEATGSDGVSKRLCY